jgi:hypothetical protein
MSGKKETPNVGKVTAHQAPRIFRFGPSKR